MDAARFDDFARALSETASRRTLLRVGASGVLAGFTLNADGAPANKKKKRKKKRKVCRKCKHGKCKKAKPDGTPCGETCHACQNGQCVIDAGASCGSSQTCLPNATCAQTCVTVLDCPPSCQCAGPNRDGLRVCIDTSDPALSCVEPFQECSTSAECPANKTCFETACGGGLKICLALCQ